MTCLGTNTLLALASDRSPDRLARFEAHVDHCAECRQLLGELANLSWMRAGRTHDDRTGEPATAPLMIGSVVDRYVVIDVLGVGGMGVVYAAYDPRLDRKIALKVLRPDHSDCPDRSARLEREAQTLARLRHPNVVAVHDAGTFENRSSSRWSSSKARRSASGSPMHGAAGARSSTCSCKPPRV